MSTTPERADLPRELDTEAIRRYFAANIEGASDAPLTCQIISGGASNVTCFIKQDSREWVLRRPPLGHFLPTAHDMFREFRCYRGLYGTGVPVPRPIAYCDDSSIIGAPFYVMQKLEGVVPNSPDDLAHTTPEQRARCGGHFVEILSMIHAVDFRAVGLADLGKPEGYLQRQVARWFDQWERSKTGECAAIDEAARRLKKALPKSPPTTIVHGDYRLGNVMIGNPDPGQIVGVFDWEMATLGDPLADVGYLLIYWGTNGGRTINPSAQVADLPGFPTADEIVRMYARFSGRAVDNVDYYVTLAYFKLAIIAQGGFARGLRAQSKTASEVPEIVERLAHYALEVANASSMQSLR